MKMPVWMPRFFVKSSDGGVNSGVTAFFLIEWKPVLSIALLHFKEGTRENYHSHAFNALTWWLSGHVCEHKWVHWDTPEYFKPSWKVKVTPRSNAHKIEALKESWAFTLRGPWLDRWTEITPDGEVITLTHGRKIINAEQEK